MKTSCLIIVLLQVTTAFSFLCNPLVNNEICPDASQVKFNLYTQNNSNGTEIFSDNLTTFTYNTGYPVVFITHGFTDFPTNPWILKIRDEIFRKEPNTIIVVVDWSAISSANYNYPIIAFKTCCSGEYAGKLMISMNKTWSVRYEDIYFVAHSLGAHFAGCAGQFVYNQTKQCIGRITGLDPAGPFFKDAQKNCKLSPDDACFVDVIHTSAEIGYYWPLAHMDFYPNGGAQQPGCPFNTTAKCKYKHNNK